MGKRGRYQFDLAGYQKPDTVLGATVLVETVLIVSDFMQLIWLQTFFVGI